MKMLLVNGCLHGDALMWKAHVLSPDPGDTMQVGAGSSHWCKSTEIEYRTFSTDPDGTPRPADLGVTLGTP